MGKCGLPCFSGCCGCWCVWFCRFISLFFFFLLSLFCFRGIPSQFLPPCVSILARACSICLFVYLITSLPSFRSPFALSSVFRFISSFLLQFQFHFHFHLSFFYFTVYQALSSCGLFSSKFFFFIVFRLLAYVCLSYLVRWHGTAVSNLFISTASWYICSISVW